MASTIITSPHISLWRKLTIPLAGIDIGIIIIETILRGGTGIDFRIIFITAFLCGSLDVRIVPVTTILCRGIHFKIILRLVPTILCFAVASTIKYGPVHSELTSGWTGPYSSPFFSEAATSGPSALSFSTSMHQHDGLPFAPPGRDYVYVDRIVMCFLVLVYGKLQTRCRRWGGWFWTYSSSPSHK